MYRLRVAIAAALVAGMALAPVAQARDWHGGRGGYGYRGGGGHFPVGAAVVGGLIGLGVGAAIAGSGPPPPVYYGPPGYYGAPPPAVYYGY
jgi:hypothetical protein